jgi:plastocyanin
MRMRVLSLSLLAVLLCVSCGGGSGGYGGGSSTSTPTAPTTPTPSATNVTTITITGQNGGSSFSPNPAMVPTGQTVIWKNADTTTHRIVMEELGIDTGNLAPGASSSPVSLGNISKTYHCSLHPAMVGALNDATTPTDGGNCGPYGC